MNITLHSIVTPAFPFRAKFTDGPVIDDGPDGEPAERNEREILPGQRFEVLRIASDAAEIVPIRGGDIVTAPISDLELWQ